MSEINEQKFKDIDKAELKNPAMAFEVAKTEELKKAGQAITQIHESIAADKPVASNFINGLKNHLDNLSVNVGKGKMNLGELAKNTELRKTVEIIKEVETGKTGRVHEITLLIPELAERLVACQKHLALNGLTELTPETARVLCKLKSRNGLDINALKFLSVETVKTLCDYFSGDLMLGMPEYTDEMIKAISKFKGQTVVLAGLEKLSEHQIIQLGTCTSQIYLPTNMGEIQGRIWQLQNENNFK